MPRTKLILCSGIFCLYITALNAQVPPKNKTVSNVVGYQLHQQKQWNYNQIPKNSVLYKSNYSYSYSVEKKNMMPLLKIEPIATPVINKKFSHANRYSSKVSNAYQKKSRFLHFYYPQQNKQDFFELYRPGTF